MSTNLHYRGLQTPNDDDDMEGEGTPQLPGWPAQADGQGLDLSDLETNGLRGRLTDLGTVFVHVGDTALASP